MLYPLSYEGMDLVNVLVRVARAGSAREFMTSQVRSRDALGAGGLTGLAYA